MPSTNLNNLMDAFDRQIKARVEIVYLNPNQEEEDKVGSASEVNELTPVAQLGNSILVPKFKLFSVGCNKLDGTWQIPIKPVSIINYETGWWSEKLTDVNGVFASPPEIVISFDLRTILGMTVTFDSVANNFGIDFDVILKNGTSVVHTVVVAGNGAATWTIITSDIIGLQADSMTVILYKTNIPRSYARILELDGSVRELYDENILLDIGLLKEINYADVGIPIGAVSANEVVVSLDNIDNRFDPNNELSPIAKELKRNRKVIITFGVREADGTYIWFEAGTFYSYHWKVDFSSKTATLVARDKLELAKQFDLVLPVQKNKTLYELFVLVFNSWGLDPSEYQIDASFNSIIFPFFWFGNITARGGLKLLALNSLASVYTNEQNIIIAKNVVPSTNVEYTFDDNINVFGRVYPFAWDVQVNQVTANYHKFELVSDDNIFNYEDDFIVPPGTNREINIIFNIEAVESVNVAITYSSGTCILTIVDVYDWGMKLNLNNVGGINAEVTRIYSSSGMVVENIWTKGVMAADTQSVIDDGPSRSRLKNTDFLQSEVYAQNLADALLILYGFDKFSVEIESRGHIALPLGDKIAVTNTQFGSRNYMNTRQEIDWNGAFSAQIEARIIGGE